MAEVIIIGNGGRENALRQAMEASSDVTDVCLTNDLETLDKYSQNDRPFIIIGPEQPLVDGLSNRLRDEGYTVFGASEQAARYEASKSFATQMMRQADIRHPRTFFTSSTAHAREYLQENDSNTFVIKADGLAGGKGVVVPDTQEEAIKAVEQMMNGTLVGDAGKVINFQERLRGSEVSAMVVVGDNDEYSILPIAQDHKRLLDNDKGPNTGGMGAYAPVPDSILSTEQYSAIVETVEQTLKGMRDFGTPFERGLLYYGFMLSQEHGNLPYVIEYNVRFGDPETQAILPLLTHSGVDTYRLLRSAAEGVLEAPTHYSNLGLKALTVCLASQGYPLSPQTGYPVYGLDSVHQNVTIQQAGIQNTQTTGGRVLCVTGIGTSLDEAAHYAYSAIDTNRIGEESGLIGFEGMHYREDIGYQGRS